MKNNSYDLVADTIIKNAHKLNTEIEILDNDKRLVFFNNLINHILKISPDSSFDYVPQYFMPVNQDTVNYVETYKLLISKFNLDKIICNIYLHEKKENELLLPIFLVDPGHGLEHGLSVLFYHLQLQNGSPISFEQFLLDIFHDFLSHVSRKNHWERSMIKLIDYFSEDGCLYHIGIQNSINIKKLKSIFNQSNDYKKHSVIQAPEDPDARFYLDADRFDELDLTRLAIINDAIGRPFFNKGITLAERLKVCNEMRGRIINSKCGIAGNDTLTIILYSLTRNLRQESYLTENGKNLIKNIDQNNLNVELERLINEYAYGDKLKIGMVIIAVRKNFNLQFI